MTIKVGVCGSNGRMGVITLEALKFSKELTLSATFNKNNAASEMDSFCKNSNVVIDFSSNTLTDELIKAAIIYKTKLVICTTGLNQAQHDLIKEASAKIPIIYASNTSIGVTLVTLLCQTASKVLGEDYDVRIVDKHHRFKKDSPSGTAIALQSSIYQQTKAISEISSIKAGGIFGEHEVIFAGLDEVITIKHQALNRELFAKGAIKAAKWLSDKPSGLYSMKDVLNIH